MNILNEVLYQHLFLGDAAHIKWFVFNDIIIRFAYDK